MATLSSYKKLTTKQRWWTAIPAILIGPWLGYSIAYAMNNPEAPDALSGLAFCGGILALIYLPMLLAYWWWRHHDPSYDKTTWGQYVGMAFAAIYIGIPLLVFLLLTPLGWIFLFLQFMEATSDESKAAQDRRETKDLLRQLVSKSSGEKSSHPTS